MKKVTIQDLVVLTEDYALELGVSLESLIQEKIKESFRIDKEFDHPAVGQVVYMVRDYSLAP
jgi:hypothetical protein